MLFTFETTNSALGFIGNKYPLTESSIKSGAKPVSVQIGNTPSDIVSISGTGPPSKLDKLKKTFALEKYFERLFLLN